MATIYTSECLTTRPSNSERFMLWHSLSKHGTHSLLYSNTSQPNTTPTALLVMGLLLSFSFRTHTTGTACSHAALFGRLHLRYGATVVRGPRGDEKPLARQQERRKQRALSLPPPPPPPPATRFTSVATREPRQRRRSRWRRRRRGRFTRELHLRRAVRQLAAVIVVFIVAVGVGIL